MPIDIDQINEGDDDGSSPTENANATEVDIVAAGALLVGLSAVARGGSGADNADTTAGAGINNTTTNNTNEGGTAATSATPKTPTQNNNNKLNLPDTDLRGPSYASEHPTKSLTGPGVRIGGGELLYEDNEEEEEEDVNDNDDRKVAAEQSKMDEEEDTDEGGVAADDAIVEEVQPISNEDRLTRVLPQSIIVDLISPNRIKFDGNVYELNSAVTLDNIVAPSEDAAADLPELQPFDVNMSRTDRPNDGMYFILLLCPGGKWKVLYGISDGNNTCDGLFLRVKSHLADSEQVGEVLFVEGSMKRKLKKLEAMMKMSAIECRPEGSCGTEIALFDSRAEAIGFIGYFSSQVKKNPSEVNMHFSYAKRGDTSDGEDSYITVANYNIGKKNKERHSASQLLTGSTRTLDQIRKERYQAKRDKFNSLSFDEKVEHINAEFNARPAPEDGEQDRRMIGMKNNGPIADFLRELAQPNIWGGLTADQRNVLMAEPINIHPNKAAFAKEQRKANALKKRRIGLQEFQEKYCDGVRPPERNSGIMKLTKEEISLGTNIAVDLRIYKRNKDELSKEMLALYRKFKLTEFDDAGDTTNHTILTAEEYDEWLTRNKIRRSGRRHDQNESSDVSPTGTTGTTTRRSAAAAAATTAATATRSSTSTKKRTSTSTTTTSNTPKRIKTKVLWSEEEKKKLEVLENKYGTAWLYFERDPDCLPGKSK